MGRELINTATGELEENQLDQVVDAPGSVSPTSGSPITEEPQVPAPSFTDNISTLQSIDVTSRSNLGEEDFLDYSKIDEDYIDQVFPYTQDIANNQAAINQDWWSKLGNSMTSGVAKGLVAATSPLLTGVGNLMEVLDMDYANTVKGLDDQLNNSISQGLSFYELELSEDASVMDQFMRFSTLESITESAVQFSVMGGVAGGLVRGAGGVLLRSGAAAKKLGMGKVIAENIQRTLGTAGRLMKNPVYMKGINAVNSQTLINGIATNYLEGQVMADELEAQMRATYSELLYDPTVSKELKNEINDEIGEAKASMKRQNTLLVVNDILGFSRLGSVLTKKLGKQLPGVLNKLRVPPGISKAIGKSDLPLLSLSEGGEEILQNVISSGVEHKSMLDIEERYQGLDEKDKLGVPLEGDGLFKPESFMLWQLDPSKAEDLALDNARNLGDFLVEHATSKQALVEGMSGMLGGGPQWMLTRLPGKVLNRKANKIQSEKQDIFMAKSKSLFETFELEKLKTDAGFEKARTQLHDVLVDGADNQYLDDVLNEYISASTIIQGIQDGHTDELGITLDEHESAIKAQLKTGELSQSDADVFLSRIKYAKNALNTYRNYASYGNSQELLANAMELEAHKAALRAYEAAQSKVDENVPKDYVTKRQDLTVVEDEIKDTEATQETETSESTKEIEDKVQAQIGSPTTPSVNNRPTPPTPPIPPTPPKAPTPPKFKGFKGGPKFEGPKFEGSDFEREPVFKGRKEFESKDKFKKTKAGQDEVQEPTLDIDSEEVLNTIKNKEDDLIKAKTLHTELIAKGEVKDAEEVALKIKDLETDLEGLRSSKISNALSVSNQNLPANTKEKEAKAKELAKVQNEDTVIQTEKEKTNEDIPVEGAEKEIDRREALLDRIAELEANIKEIKSPAGQIIALRNERIAVKQGELIRSINKSKSITYLQGKIRWANKAKEKARTKSERNSFEDIINTSKDRIEILRKNENATNTKSKSDKKESDDNINNNTIETDTEAEARNSEDPYDDLEDDPFWDTKEDDDDDPTPPPNSPNNESPPPPTPGSSSNSNTDDPWADFSSDDFFSEINENLGADNPSNEVNPNEVDPNDINNAFDDEEDASERRSIDEGDTQERIDSNKEVNDAAMNVLVASDKAPKEYKQPLLDANKAVKDVVSVGGPQALDRFDGDALQLLKMDHPEAFKRVEDVIVAFQQNTKRKTGETKMPSFDNVLGAVAQTIGLREPSGIVDITKAVYSYYNGDINFDDIVSANKVGKEEITDEDKYSIDVDPEFINTSASIDLAGRAIAWDGETTVDYRNVRRNTGILFKVLSDNEIENLTIIDKGGNVIKKEIPAFVNIEGNVVSMPWKVFAAMRREANNPEFKSTYENTDRWTRVHKALVKTGTNSSWLYSDLNARPIQIEVTSGQRKGSNIGYIHTAQWANKKRYHNGQPVPKKTMEAVRNEVYNMRAKLFSSNESGIPLKGKVVSRHISIDKKTGRFIGTAIKISNRKSISPIGQRFANDPNMLYSVVLDDKQQISGAVADAIFARKQEYVIPDYIPVGAVIGFFPLENSNILVAQKLNTFQINKVHMNYIVKEISRLVDVGISVSPKQLRRNIESIVPIMHNESTSPKSYKFNIEANKVPGKKGRNELTISHYIGSQKFELKFAAQVKTKTSEKAPLWSYKLVSATKYDTETRNIIQSFSGPRMTQGMEEFKSDLLNASKEAYPYYNIDKDKLNNAQNKNYTGRAPWEIIDMGTHTRGRTSDYIKDILYTRVGTNIDAPTLLPSGHYSYVTNTIITVALNPTRAEQQAYKEAKARTLRENAEEEQRVIRENKELQKETDRKVEAIDDEIKFWKFMYELQNIEPTADTIQELLGDNFTLIAETFDPTGKGLDFLVKTILEQNTGKEIKLLNERRVEILYPGLRSIGEDDDTGKKKLKLPNLKDLNLDSLRLPNTVDTEKDIEATQRPLEDSIESASSSELESSKVDNKITLSTLWSEVNMNTTMGSIIAALVTEGHIIIAKPDGDTKGCL